MQSIIDFFFSPYQNTDLVFIILELIAAIMGIISVIYAKRENILVFPVGIISTGIYIYLLYKWQLYGDLLINVYYTIMSIYGWYMWMKIIDTDNSHIKVTRASKMDYLKASLIFITTSIFVIIVYRYYNIMSSELDFVSSLEYIYKQVTSNSLVEFRKAIPYMDTFTTGAAFAAMWMMANKKLESWSLWIIVNIVSIPLYFAKGLGFTAIQYSIFLVLAILGHFAWKQIIKAEND